jgi:hypothetical protein
MSLSSYCAARMPCGVIFTTQIPRQCLAATVRRAVFPGTTHCRCTRDPWRATPSICTNLVFGSDTRFLLWSLRWWGSRKRGVPLPCVTSAYTTSSHALQRSVTSLRPTTSTPVHVGLLRLRIPQRRSAFFPGTELAFSAEVICASSRLFSWRTISSRTAVFRQIDKDVPQVHHDALEFPDGTFVLLTDLHEGQQATVLQLPAQPKTLAEAAVQTRVVYVG